MREGQEMQAFAQRPPPADADADTDADANRSVDQDMLLGAMVGEARPGPGAPDDQLVDPWNAAEAGA